MTNESNTGITIVIADDHRAIRDGLRIAFEEAGATVVADVGDGNQLVEAALRLRPMAILSDVNMPRCSGIEATRKIVEAWPAARIVMLTMHDDIETIRSALVAGACAFLSKDCAFSDVLGTIQKVVAGETVLSPNIATEVLRYLSEAPKQPEEILSDRQVEILQAVANGLNTAQIARQFQLSPKTVNNHLAAIYRRLDTQNLTQAILRAVRLGIIDINNVG